MKIKFEMAVPVTVLGIVLLLAANSMAKNFDLSFASIEANDQMGKARWEAQYDFFCLVGKN